MGITHSSSILLRVLLLPFYTPLSLWGTHPNPAHSLCLLNSRESAYLPNSSLGGIAKLSQTHHIRNGHHVFVSFSLQDHVPAGGTCQPPPFLYVNCVGVCFFPFPQPCPITNFRQSPSLSTTPAPFSFHSALSEAVQPFLVCLLTALPAVRLSSDSALCPIDLCKMLHLSHVRFHSPSGLKPTSSPAFRALSGLFPAHVPSPLFCSCTHLLLQLHCSVHQPLNILFLLWSFPASFHLFLLQILAIYLSS